MKINIKGMIDRFEGDYAVILIGDDGDQRFDLPRSLLPAGTKEGDYLTISIKSSPGKTIEAKKKVEEMLRKLKQK